MNYTCMAQIGADTFTVIHLPAIKPEINDGAMVFHKTALHKRDRTSNVLKIIEVLETRPHKTDPNNLISVVRCEAQN